MGRDDVYQVLKKFPNTWMSVEQICKEVGFSNVVVSKNLNQVYKNDITILKRHHPNLKTRTGMQYMYAKKFDKK